MMHLTEDQLYHLAELSCDAEELNTEEDQQFDHVKSCRECFNQYSQMIDKYSENISKTVMDNCGNLIYLHTREISFLEYISKLAGKNEFGRPLLSVSRLQHLKKNETVIFHDRCYPMVVQDLPLVFEYSMELDVL